MRNHKKEMTMHTLFELTGKTALITGASSGLGEQFARTLSNAGARVILAARRLEKLEGLSSELGNAKAIQMNVADKNLWLIVSLNLIKVVFTSLV